MKHTLPWRTRSARGRMWTLHPPAWLALGAVLTAGCGGPQIDLAPRATSWPGRSTAADAAGQPLDLAVMRRLVLDHHPAILAAQQKLAAASARRRGAGRWPNPQLDGRVLAVDEGSAEIEGALLFSIPLSGHRRAAGKVAQAEQELARLDLAAAQQQALLELEMVLVRLACSREGLTLQEELAAQSEQNAILARQRQSASMADPLDVALVLADASQDRRAVLRGRNEVARLEAALCLLLGIPPDEQTFVLPSTHPPDLVIDPAEVVGTAFARRLPLRRARTELERAEWDATRSARERIPDLTLGPAATRVEGQTSYGLAFGLGLPLFSSGGPAHAAARAARDAARHRLAAEERATEIDVRNRCAQLASLQAELAALTGEAEEAAGRALALAQERYAAGQIDVLRLLSAHRAFAGLKLEILNLVLTQWETLLELEAAVGVPLRAGAPGRDER